MITCVVNDARGRPLGTVAVDLLKARVFLRLRDALVSGTPGVFYKSLEQIDTGKLPLTTLARVYSPEEIKAAILKRRSAVQAEGEALDELLTMLEDPGFWSAAQGGEQAAGRFGVRNYDVPRGSRRDVFGGGADRGEHRELETRNKPPGKGTEQPLSEMKSMGGGVLRKSSTAQQSCGGHLERHGYTKVDDRRERNVWAHPHGHTADIGPTGEWVHHHAVGRVMSGHGADGLGRFLDSLHAGERPT